MSKPAQVFPPGLFILEELITRGKTLDDLRTALGWRNSAWTLEVLDGTRDISSEASALGVFFDVPPEFFLNLQKAWDER